MEALERFYRVIGECKSSRLTFSQSNLRVYNIFKAFKVYRVITKKREKSPFNPFKFNLQTSIIEITTKKIYFIVYFNDFIDSFEIFFRARYLHANFCIFNVFLKILFHVY